MLITYKTNLNDVNCQNTVVPVQLVGHYSANAEVTGSTLVETPKIFFFFRATLQLLKL